MSERNLGGHFKQIAIDWSLFVDIPLILISFLYQKSQGNVIAMTIPELLFCNYKSLSANIFRKKIIT